MDIEKIKALTDDGLIQTYRAVRARIEAEDDAQKLRMKPIKELLTVLEADGQRRMLEAETTGFKGAHGTCFAKTQVSMSVKDKAAFFKWLQETGNWDMADIRASKTDIAANAEKTGGELPPGVHMTTRTVAQFRAPTNK